MPNQLDLTALQLKQIGFNQQIKDNKVFYFRNVINGFFYFNPLETEYVWYLKIIVGEAANHIHLDIRTKDELIRLLNIFRVLNQP